MLDIGDKNASELHLGLKKIIAVYLGSRAWSARSSWLNTKYYIPLSENNYFPGNRVLDQRITLPIGNRTVSLWCKVNKERSGQYVNGARDYWAMLGKYWWAASRESFIAGISCREKTGNKIGFWARNTGWVEVDPRSWQLEGIRAEIWEWNHVAMSYNSATNTFIFVNNGNVVETRAVNLSNLWSHPITIGWVYNVWSTIQNYFTGRIKEVIVEDKARSPEEISAYYKQTKLQWWGNKIWPTARKRKINSNTYIYMPLKNDFMDHKSRNLWGDYSGINFRDGRLWSNGGYKSFSEIDIIYFTFHSLIKLSNTSGYQIWYRYSDSSGNDISKCYLTGYWTVRIVINNTEYDTGYTAKSDKEYLYSIIISQSKLAFYVDWEKKFEQAISWVTRVSNAEFCLLNRWYNPNEWLQWSIREFLMETNEWTDQEVLDYYNQIKQQFWL